MPYHLTYRFTDHKDALSRAEVQALASTHEGLGACDAAIVVSIIYPPDGSYSQTVLSHDGKTGLPLTSRDIWKAWAMMAASMMNDPDLGANSRELCAFVHTSVSKALALARQEEIPT